MFEGIVPAFQEHTELAQSEPHSCGALAHTFCVMQGCKQDALPQALLLCNRLSGLYHTGRAAATGGLSPGQIRAFQALLQEKAAVETLGAKAVLSALGAANPWQALKSAASTAAPIFEFVLYDELQDHIAQHAASKHGAQVHSAKAKKAREATRKGAQTPVQIDPGHVGENGTPVSQLDLSEVVADAQGLAFCTPQQVTPFLQDFQSMSVHPLGLLPTAELPNESTAGIPASYLRGCDLKRNFGSGWLGMSRLSS